MSRFITEGTHPETGEVVDIAYGWDCVPGFKPGYFFQVWSRNPLDGEDDSEGLLVNEGFLAGLDKSRLTELAREWSCKLKEV